ncbi:hypothetical protein K438DRAFT_1973023 [Mycena galopus ATCC 62051]|nr:hypothetical protein K438DRAFT_1973023 [Mycena galopus ATCC 62051]
MFFQTATHGRSRSFTLTSILVAADLASAMSAHVFLYILISHRGLVHTRVSQQGPQHAPQQSHATLTPYFLSRISYAPHRRCRMRWSVVKNMRPAPQCRFLPAGLIAARAVCAMTQKLLHARSGVRGLRHDSEAATRGLWRARLCTVSARTTPSRRAGYSILAVLPTRQNATLPLLTVHAASITSPPVTTLVSGLPFSMPLMERTLYFLPSEAIRAQPQGLFLRCGTSGSIYLE